MEQQNIHKMELCRQALNEQHGNYREVLNFQLKDTGQNNLSNPIKALGEKTQANLF